ncbi:MULTISPECIES: methylated-DNA--[protein]-cysteine S-methyltransferase [unclassified Caballeronia]|jgi:methylated-DNA-[protein]-cysteine S-methyltransferase|uniref:methylated-DNA--[protein]-cysteine S-methyltransferase n=1 Tax=unclassified Caballeronia TaxID=2646786 RepID=UPI00202941F6|nr:MULTISPECIES: methylated-DNA--[protein]-cysteine S-methyltransferase [unclassified Caballeronia]MDR5804130.1 methylated-DNA--[protein]-cysteine S-methyltransferase [Caballeronia sp. LZ001]
MKHFDAVIDAPFGKVGIRADERAVREIVYLSAEVESIESDKPLVQQAIAQIRQYFEQPAMRFDLPLGTGGTAFQERVWKGISGIAAGQVWTYGQLAREVGSVPRAVGQACGSNPLPIVIPCHRVVSSSGIGGFAHTPGDGFFRDVKRWLLAHEGVSIA